MQSLAVYCVPYFRVNGGTFPIRSPPRRFSQYFHLRGQFAARTQTKSGTSQSQ